MFDFNKLNNMQKLAVETISGPVLVVAGAGSGKTRALTSRIYNLIKNHGVSPHNILAITFTNKATREMKERLASVDNGGLQISTFHAFCAKVLRQYAHLINGYTKYFTIYDDSDTMKLIKRIIKDKDLDEDGMHKTAASLISTAKNDGVLPTEFQKKYFYVKDVQTYTEIYMEYENQLKTNNAFDFDDLLFKALFLLTNNQSVLFELQQKYKYIHIDEFQDTNVVQYKIVKLLAATHKNLFVVGDEDQSIYGWRGASVENTSKFVQEFSPKVIKLEQNYRSTKNILEIANKLILHNKSRIEKNLWTDNQDSHNVHYYKAYSDYDEAEFVARSIHNLIKYENLSPNNIAILYRINSLSRLFEEKLLNYNIPYNIYGGFKFFDRQEIKSVLSYLWLLFNPNDSENVKKVINFPKRGIGKVSVEKLEELAAINQKPIYEIILNPAQYGIKGALASRLQVLSNIFAEFNKLDRDMAIGELYSEVVRIAEIKEAYDKSKDEDDERLRNIGQLERSVKEFEYQNPELGLIDYLQSVALQAEFDDGEEQAESVKISTIHASKGLEFDAVFVVGAEEKIFPLSRSMNSEAEIEEERRLMYVGVTRSRKYLTISSSENRFLYSGREFMIPSRFLSEMGLVKARPVKEYMPGKNSVNPFSVDSASFKLSAEDSSYDESIFGSKNIASIMPWDKEKETSMNNYAGDKIGVSDNLSGFMASKLKKQSENYSSFVVGVQVFHTKFGIGTIVESDVLNGSNNIKVNFATVGAKTLNLEFAPLKIFGKKD